ncbi:hypothetical protein MLD38_021713 [Melastoma candidum]|uniref:Uncharacterized protein n=1 Tax=Melastoma candidum TaxID=119954 RepID=A0ACB9QQ23_9MYRT|nr:hypothetical protein MLD38_021713 [Melastoma candidum]
MEKLQFLQQQQQMSLAKCSRQRFSEWIFRDVPSDVTIDVGGTVFALHKFPLVSRCGKIRKLVAGHRDSDVSRVELLNLPGGANYFELAAKFCYGINFEITPANVAQLCCISDYLEMTEEFSKDNLGSRAEEYLDCVVCRSLEMSVEVLRQCEGLVPLADELGIVGRCIDAIATRASTEQIASSFSRLEYSSSGRLHISKPSSKCDGDWWIEDISNLGVEFYQKVVVAMKCRGVRPESIGTSLVNYAEKELTKRSSLWTQPADQKLDDHEDHEKIVLETIVSLLPVEKQAVPLNYLFGFLRGAVTLDCADGCRIDLERRIASRLEMASLDDLLIPSFKHSGDTLFDVDTVHRILVNFSQQEVSDEDDDDMVDGSVFESNSPRSPSQTALYKVAKLVDNYLAEIAPDANLKLPKFIVIAEALPAHARTVHDGLYRAIDVYLKAHQALPESDRKRLCKLIDFQKLSQEAGTHAAQNERLPLQSIVQVLYFEQVRLRNALSSSYDKDDPKPPIHQSWRIGSGALSAAMSPRDNYASLRRENRELKLELARLRMRLNDLEKEHVCMKRDMEKSGSRKFAGSFSKKIGKFRIFGHVSSRGSSSPSKQSPRADSKAIERAYASTED